VFCTKKASDGAADAPEALRGDHAKMKRQHLTPTMLLSLTVISAMALTACGSGTSSRTVTVQRVVTQPATVIVRSAAVTTPDSAPVYCKTLSRSRPVLGLSTAIDKLAQTPDDVEAHSTIQRASAEIASAAAATTGAPRAALRNAALALRTLARQGLSAAGTSVSTALQNLGTALEAPCSFPVG
jgi:hypothetical protein